MPKKMLPAPDPLRDRCCSYCGGGPVHPTTRTCRVCQTTMPTNWEEFKDAPQRVISGGISNAGAILAGEYRYHGPGQRVTDEEYE